MTPALVALLLAVRAACVALIEAIDAFDTAPESEEENGVCLHREQHRQPAPAMGQPNRYMCKRCKEMVSPI